VVCADSRLPNVEELGLDHAGVRLGADGRVTVDQRQRTSAAGAWRPHGRSCVERAGGDPWRSQGALKLVVDQDTQEILGAHMAGPESTEGIAQVVLAMEAGIGYRQLLRPHHLHPSMAEVVGLAFRLDDLARNA
jgi:pyruvate/2-oxoglutarate dehydrogenase complex dihydrolipoamide dehydrogenase (E3) component